MAGSRSISALIVLLLIATTPIVRAATVTTGIYDETTRTNAVDFEVPGSTIDLATFKQDIVTAFAKNLGGVADGRSVVQSSYSFGVSQNKSLTILTAPTEDSPDGELLSTLNLSTHPNTAIPISTNTAFVAFPSTGTSQYVFGNVQNGAPGDGIVEFGITILSRTDDELGDVTVSVYYSDLTTASLTRTIPEASGVGDTFYGFTAATGKTITGFTITNTGAAGAVFFDDIGFVVTPEPTSIGLLAFGIVALKRRQRV